MNCLTNDRKYLIREKGLYRKRCISTIQGAVIWKIYSIRFRECNLHRYMTSFIKKEFNSYVQEQMESTVKEETESMYTLTPLPLYV